MSRKRKVECPRCLGSKQFMEAKETKGFNYNKCDMCDEEGLLEQDIADDFILSQNEENIEFDNNE